MRDGGPAFPQPGGFQRPDGWISGPSEGMTLRDWFAGMALQGIINRPDLCPSNKEEQDHLAKRVYEMADAMLSIKE